MSDFVMPEEKRMSRNWLNLRFSVGMVPYLYMLARLALAFEWALLCLGCERKCFFVFLDEPTLFGAADMKLSFVEKPCFMLYLPPRAWGDLIYRLGKIPAYS